MNFTPTTLRARTQPVRSAHRVSGCRGSSPTSSAGQPSVAHFQQQFAAFASRTRSHGEPDYPTRNSPAKAVLLGQQVELG
jgi:hypothetical protein